MAIRCYDPFTLVALVGRLLRAAGMPVPASISTRRPTSTARRNCWWNPRAYSLWPPHEASTQELPELPANVLAW
eukprot:NODE_21685_length_741_cov_3.656352.p4 GENE.NODE_21685_length_741_cov_3.656352~~NODE_21685_length_741_cov_3.656352.p4  ORF type:complete len:74 (+),score=0.54 NODE_21685_length_741_cov_3.656352:163-384(+)